jgi:hypothetical protein
MNPTPLPLLIVLSLAFLTGRSAPAPWAATNPAGAAVRVAVGPVDGSPLRHLAWPKAVRTANGTIVLGYQIGSHHGDGSSPAVSLSTDNGRSFTAPHVLRRFGPDQEYSNSGNMALGLAHDGAVVLLSHGHRGNEANHIFGWRSTDHGRTWSPVDTSALGPNKTGSSTGTIVQLPGKQLMVVGHYRRGSQPYHTGIWQSISKDDGLTWGEPSMVSNVNGGEPLLVRHGDRLLVFIRGRGPATVHQYIAVSDNFGQTWQTELSNLRTRNPHSTLITHPFAMVHPRDPATIVAATIERPQPATAELWYGNPRTLEFKHQRTLLNLPKIEGDPNDDFGYPWLVPLNDSAALLFYYHGRRRGDASIWVTEVAY